MLCITRSIRRYYRTTCRTASGILQVCCQTPELEKSLVESVQATAQSRATTGFHCHARHLLIHYLIIQKIQHRYGGNLTGRTAKRRLLSSALQFFVNKMRIEVPVQTVAHPRTLPRAVKGIIFFGSNHKMPAYEIKVNGEGVLTASIARWFLGVITVNSSHAFGSPFVANILSVQDKKWLQVWVFPWSNHLICVGPYQLNKQTQVFTRFLHPSFHHPLQLEMLPTAVVAAKLSG